MFDIAIIKGKREEVIEGVSFLTIVGKHPIHLSFGTQGQGVIIIIVSNSIVTILTSDIFVTYLVISDLRKKTTEIVTLPTPERRS